MLIDPQGARALAILGVAAVAAAFVIGVLIGAATAWVR